MNWLDLSMKRLLLKTNKNGYKGDRQDKWSV